MMADMTPKASWLVRHVVLCRIWRAVSWFLLPFCYLGALIAPAVVLSIPFQVFHWHHFSPQVIWITTGLLGTFTLWLLWRAVLSGWRFFQQRVIYVEAIILSVALVFAVAVIVWLYPPK
jgi:hypothetical protein